LTYNVIQEDTLEQLIRHVNEYQEMGWKCAGGLLAVRRSISGSLIYMQAVTNVDGVVLHKRGRPLSPDGIRRLISRT
jgi:hypothetical protein